MRHTRSHTRNRRSHHALVEGNLVTDKESGALRLPHRIDESTGMYRGIQIVPKKEVKAETKKRDKRVKEHSHKDDNVVDGVKEPVHADKHVATELVEKKSQGIMGRMTKGKAKARSGFGGGAGA
ncbi:MAG: rpmF [Parcubacteria group bacterium]|nr:rpmF [Parcubacteria group bacterium]